MRAVTVPVRVQFTGHGGVTLVGDRWGEPAAPAVVFLHGGGQTRHSWGAAAAAVAEPGRQAITLDARGHGESDWAADADYRLAGFAEDLRLVIDQVGHAPVLVGASLGGLTSLLLAGELAPGVARGVVLVDIVPDMEQAGAERIAAFMADRLADGFASLDEVADAVAAYNPHRDRPADVDGLRRNLRERDGRLYWHWDPRFMDTENPLLPVEIVDVDRLHAAVGRMVAEVPVLLVRGRMSDLVSEDKAAAFLERFPEVDFVDVSGAGHMVAGDRNDAFTTAVLDFLDEHFPTG